MQTAECVTTMLDRATQAGIAVTHTGKVVTREPSDASYEAGSPLATAAAHHPSAVAPLWLVCL